MPFQQISRLQQRQQLAQRVLVGELTIAEASRAYGVSWPTAQLWVKRAAQVGVAHLAEGSRRPHHSPQATPERLVAQVLALREQYPRRGAKKLHAMLWRDPSQAPICVKTVDRILRRHGKLVPRVQRQAADQRFEYPEPNLLWQMDFKGLDPLWPYVPFTVLDDHSRYCLAFVPLDRAGTEEVWAALWAVLGEHGLPAAVLSDNARVFCNLSGPGPSKLEARLWRLGIRTIHGRCRHPETQGKVERFHRSLEDEWSEQLRQPSQRAAEREWPWLVREYNWVRPHEALGMQVPGAVYRPAVRRRPDELPEPPVSEGAIGKRCDRVGQFRHGGVVYRAGMGLAGERVEIREEDGQAVLYFAGVRIAPLEELKV